METKLHCSDCGADFAVQSDARARVTSPVCSSGLIGSSSTTTEERPQTETPELTIIKVEPEPAPSVASVSVPPVVHSVQKIRKQEIKKASRSAEFTLFILGVLTLPFGIGLVLIIAGVIVSATRKDIVSTKFLCGACGNEVLETSFDSNCRCNALS